MFAQSTKSPSGPGSRRDRRPAVWPWLVMPLVVLVVFYFLYHLRQSPQPAPSVAEPAGVQASGAAPERGAAAPDDSGPR